MFNGITLESFNDPDFKEDSVRELVVAPMLARLGYLHAGATRVIRSKSLSHPFIRIGTRNHPVTVVPDYTLVHEDKPIFILDAKGPNEDILDNKHVQQAYSYAMHPEIACREFGLCNGKQLAIFNVFNPGPLLVVQFQDFEPRWPDIEKHLSVRFLLNPAMRDFVPDFGLALARVGLEKTAVIMMIEVRLGLFGRVSDRLYTAGSNVRFGTLDHCVSFDFPAEMLSAIVAGLPPLLGVRFSDALGRAPFMADAGLIIELDLMAHLGELTQGQHDEFVPIVIDKILKSRSNFDPIDEKKDVPDHVFQLRKAVVVKR